MGRKGADRTDKQKKADAKRSRAMKGKKPAFLKKRKKGGKKGGKTRTKARTVASRVGKFVRSGEQSPFSWFSSVVALATALAPVAKNAKWALDRKDFGFFVKGMTRDYVGFDIAANASDRPASGFHPEWLSSGLGSMATAIVYKKESSFVHKMAPVRSILPSNGKVFSHIKNIITNTMAQGATIASIREAGIVAGTPGQSAPLPSFARLQILKYTGLETDINMHNPVFHKENLILGHGPFGTAVIFHKGTAQLGKHIKLRSILPRIG